MKKKTIVKKKVVAKKVAAKESKLVVGRKAPAFAMESSDGRTVTSAGLKGVCYVLYFYPKDMTPGCTTEAHEFSALANKFAKSGMQIFGVSPDSIASHVKFIKKEGITFPLLSDAGHKVALRFGVWVEKSMYGKKYMGINRSTFVVGIDGKIEAAYHDVKAKGHAVCVLEDLRE